MQTKPFTCPTCGSRYAQPTTITLKVRQIYSGPVRTLHSTDGIARVEWEATREEDGTFRWRFSPLDRCCGRMPGGYAPTQAQARADAIAAFQRHAADLGITVLEGLTLPEQGTLLMFWKVVRCLEAHGTKLNHASDPNTFALNLADLEKVKMSMTKRDVATLKKSSTPRFVAIQDVTSALTGETVECLVFTGWPLTKIEG